MAEDSISSTCAARAHDDRHGEGVLGDPTGGDDLERALEIAMRVDSPMAVGDLNNLAVVRIITATCARGRASSSSPSAERFGDAPVRFVRGNGSARLDPRQLGRVAASGGRFIAECEAGSPHTWSASARCVRGYIRLARGDTEVPRRQPAGLELAREAEPFHRLVARSRSTAGSYAELGRVDEARALVRAGRCRSSARTDCTAR